MSRKSIDKPFSRKLTSYDWIWGILTSWAEENKNKKLPLDSVYKAFLKLSKNHPDFFPNLHFRESGKEILSNELEDILFLLGAAGVISVQNPRYTYMSISKSPKVAIKKIEKWGGHGALNKLNSLTTIFRDIVKEDAKDMVS